MAPPDPIIVLEEEYRTPAKDNALPHSNRESFVDVAERMQYLLHMHVEVMLLIISLDSHNAAPIHASSATTLGS